MEHLWLVILAPLGIVVGLSIAYWLCHPGRICRSTTEMFKSAIRDDRGQDLVEYALMAGFVAMAAGAVMPGVVAIIKTAFGRACAAIDGVAYVATPAVASEQATIIRVVCAVLAVALLGVIILRRHNMPE